MGVTVGLAGPFRLLLDDRPGAEPVIGSDKERRLLALLAVHRTRAVPTEQIVDVLWPTHPPARPAQNVATLVSRLRALLGPEVIVGGRGVYRLGDPPAVQVDLARAGALVREARQRLADDAPALALPAAAKALALLDAGEALQGEPDADWVAAARAERRQLVQQARHCAAEAGLPTRRHTCGSRGRGRPLRRALTPDRTWLLVEPFAGDSISDNLNPVGRIYYSFSCFLCVPNGRSQPGGYSLGAQAGEQAMRQVMTDAGFTRFRRAAETPFNIVYEVRP